MGSSGLAFHSGSHQEVCGADPAGPLEAIRQELLHQVLETGKCSWTLNITN